MTTTVERSRINSDDSEHVTFEENPDLMVHLLRGGLPVAKEAERGIVLVYLGVDDDHSEAQLRPLWSNPNVDMLTEAIDRLTTVRDELRRLA